MTDSDEVKLLPCEELLRDWQAERSEWHGPTTLEVVREYAVWREARPPVVTDEVVEQVARVNAAYHEALRRYPDAQGALVFFWAASGLGAVEPTAEHIDWAKSVIASIPSRNYGGLWTRPDPLSPRTQPVPQDKPMERWGIRYAGAQGTVTLAQIAGEGRVLLECNGRKWWSKPPEGAAWEAFETDSGQTYASKADAEAVIVNLTRSQSTPDILRSEK